MRTLTRLSLALSALLLGAAAPHAQPGGPGGGPATGGVAGRVVDAESGEGLPAATVAVWRRADSTLASGAVTDAAGAFRVEGLRPGGYYVVVSSLGYVTLRRAGVEVAAATVDLGALTLTPDVTSLGDVDVTAARARVEVGIDRTAYNTADLPVAAGGSATDVLETIPSVDVSADGNVSLRGSGNVAVLINGRPAPVSAEFIAAYLRGLPAGAIERVEVIPNPSARYEPDGMGGILNLVLRQNTDLGLGGVVSAGGDTRGGYHATGTLTYGRGPWTLAAGYGFRRSRRDGDGTSYRINRYDDPLTYLDQVSDDDDAGRSHLVNATADYALGPRTTLTLAGQAARRDEAEDERTVYRILDASESLTLAYERLTAGSEDGWDGDVRLGFRHDFATAPAGARRRGGEARTAGEGGGERGGMGGPGGGHGGMGGRGGGGGRSASGGLGDHTLAVEARFSRSEGDDESRFTQRALEGTDAPAELQQTRNARARRQGTFQLDYARPLAGFRLETGYQGQGERLETDFFSETADATGTFVPDLDLNNAFAFEQWVHAGYLQGAREFGPLGVQAGVRLEAAQTTFTLENPEGDGGANTGEANENPAGEGIANDYVSAFPSAFLTYRLSPRDVLRTSYSRRINRPRTWFLNPFPRYDDPLNLSTGNPALRPEYVDALEASYLRYTPWGSLTLTPYWRRTTDVIRRIQRVRDDGVTVSTFENLDTSSSYGGEAILSLDAASVLPGLRGYVSLEGYRVVTDGTNAQADLESDAFGWGGRVNATFSPRPGTDLQVNARYRAPMATEQGRSGARVGVDLALRQRLLDGRASLTLSARDPFALASFRGVIDEPELYQEFERSMGGRQVGLTFTYTLGRADRRDRPATRERDEPRDMEDVEL